MKDILRKLSSRKFLTAIVVQVAGIIGLFSPSTGDVAMDLGMRIAALVAIVLGALGYGLIEARLDATSIRTDGESVRAAGFVKVGQNLIDVQGDVGPEEPLFDAVASYEKPE